MEITPATQQSQIDTIALALVNRYLSEVDARTIVDTTKLSNAIQRSSELTRHTIFLLAHQVRNKNWSLDKSIMARSIPVLQALIEVDPHKHYYFGQLAHALKDCPKPDWQGAKSNYDRAVDLLGDSAADGWPYYNINRAICSIKLDAKFADGKPTEPSGRKAILQDLRVAQLGIYNFSEILDQPWNLDVRKWLQQNGNPHLDYSRRL